MLNCRTKFLAIIIFLCSLFVIGIGVNVSANNSQKIKANVEFLDDISGSNKFIFNVSIENDIEGTIKEFFIEDGQKIVPVSTYEVSKNKYVIVVVPGSKEFSISNVKLGVTLVVNRAEENIKGIASLDGENKNFRSGRVVNEPMLLYHDQDKIMLAVQIDDPWDTLKNVQAVLVYPELSKDFEVSFEKKYVIVSGQLKQFVYISMKSFRSNQVLKFNINLLFQRGLNDVSLRGISKVFSYNFDVDTIVKKFVKSVYSNLLGRQATDSEIEKNSKSLINNSISATNFIISIVEGNEFKNVNMSDEDFVSRVYKITLNRVPDNDGKNYWVNEIKKSSRLEVLKQILKSDEYIRLMKEIGLSA